MDLEQINIEEIMQKLNEQEQTVVELQNRRKELAKEQVTIFFKYLDKLKPALNFIKEKRYYFKNEKIDYVATQGPVIGFDQEKKLLLVYNLKEDRAQEISIYNNEETYKVISYHTFLEYDFQTAIEGLLSALDAQTRMIKIHQADIEKRESILSAYNPL